MAVSSEVCPVCGKGGYEEWDFIDHRLCVRKLAGELAKFPISQRQALQRAEKAEAEVEKLKWILRLLTYEVLCPAGSDLPGGIYDNAVELVLNDFSLRYEERDR